MEGLDDAAMEQLLNRHIELSTQGLTAVADGSNVPRLIIWPESPMTFTYSRDPRLREIVGRFAKSHRASILLNSLEPAPNGGDYNSAVMVNEEGRIVAQYDKIRLMPFGEYVPLPRWIPGASSVRGIVGDFTPGSSYTLMPLGAFRAGVFICIEAAYPSVARGFANQGANVLINISNDGYLGPTPVMRQHLSNAIFRAVENDRTLIRVTNSGNSALIEADGHVSDVTGGFQTAVRTWRAGNRNESTTFYTRHGDVFVYGCALISLGFVSATFMNRRKRNEH
jgi:apolipoprotein N-acyltransferase